MKMQTSQRIAAPTNGVSGKGFRFAAAMAAVIIVMVFAAGTAAAGTSDVNVVNTPTVNVGNTPSVSVANTPSVNVANTPAVSISGTPTVNANATVTAPGPLTNVGRLASQQLQLAWTNTCPTTWTQLNADGSLSCFDMSSHAGQVLIITDVSWGASAAAGNTCLTSILAPNGYFAFVRSAAVAAADTAATKTEHLTTGAKMTINPVVQTGCSLTWYEVHGYLAPNQ